MRRILFHCIAIAALVILDPHVAPAQEPALINAYNTSGQDLFRQFAAAPGNIVFSPYSIGTAMAMALSGARGETAEEMAKVLKQTLPRSAMESANGQVLATLNGYDKSAVPPVCPAGMKVEGTTCKGPRTADGRCQFPMRPEGNACTGPAQIAPSARLAAANALMLTRFGNLAIAPDYAALLKDKYGAEVFKDIKLADVNDWVKRKTEGKIDKILDQLDESSAAVLLNAVYFKAAWASPFVKSNTKDEDFFLASSQKVSIPTMHASGSYAVVTKAGFRAVRLPYVVHSLGLVVVVPDKIDGVREVGNQVAGTLPQLLTEFRSAPSKRIAISLPRFKTSFKADLVPSFKTAGMRLAFDDRADFSGMTGPSKIGLKIGRIAHRAVIEVDEEGSEAAAATAITMMPTSARPPEPPEPFRVDRPFLFYLVDDATGAILFQGRIMDPR